MTPSFDGVWNVQTTNEQSHHAIDLYCVVPPSQWVEFGAIMSHPYHISPRREVHHEDGVDVLADILQVRPKFHSNV